MILRRAWSEALRTAATAEAALAERFSDPLSEGVAGLLAASAELPTNHVQIALQADGPIELLGADQPGVQQAVLRTIEDLLTGTLQACPVSLGGDEHDRLVQDLHWLDRLIRVIQPELELRKPTVIVDVLRFLTALPEIDSRAFDARFLDINVRRLLGRMIEVAKVLTATEAELEQRFKLGELPSIIEVERHRQALAAGGAFASFKASVKAARAAHAELLRRPPPQRPGLVEAEADLRRLVAYLQAKADFASNERYRALLGEAFKGHRSDFRSLARAARLAEQATSILDHDAATVLLRLPAAVIEHLRAALDDASLQSALQALPDSIEPAATIDEVEAVCLRLRRLHVAVKVLGFRPEMTRAVLLELQDTFTTYFKTAAIRYGPKPFGVDPDGLGPDRVTALQHLLAKDDPTLGIYPAATRASAIGREESIVALERTLTGLASTSIETLNALGLDQLSAFAAGEASRWTIRQSPISTAPTADLAAYPANPTSTNPASDL